jgi:hypothetical protein
MDLLRWQQCCLDLLNDDSYGIISAPRGEGKTTLGLCVAKIIAGEGGRVAFISEFLRSWYDYYGNVFDDVKKKTKNPIRRGKFDGEFPNGGKIDLIAPNLMATQLLGWSHDFVIFDNADMLDDQQGAFIETRVRAPGILMMGYLVGASPYFKRKWLNSAENNWTGLAFHVRENTFIDRRIVENADRY